MRQHHFLTSPSFSNGIAERANEKFGLGTPRIALYSHSLDQLMEDEWLFVRSGSKPIEFEKGTSAIAVPSLDKLASAIDALIAAVRNGELDEPLAVAGKGSV